MPAAVEDLVDLIGYHEVGHAYAEAYGIAASSHWLQELIASYFAYTFLAAKRPGLAEVWDAMADATLATHVPMHRTLADFDKLYFNVGMPDLAWYHQVFQQRVRELHAKHGMKLFADLKQAFPAGSPPLGEAALLARLEQIAPGFQAWAAKLR